MGNYENLKQSITEVIRTNGNQEITGAVLQSTLLTIISTVGANATFAGIATPSTNPGTPDGPVFYLASESGTYTNFGSIELQDGLSVLLWNGSWSSQQIFGVDDKPNAGSDNLVKGGGVAKEITNSVSSLNKQFQRKIEEYEEYKELQPNISSLDDSLYIVDKFGNIIAQFNASGLEAIRFISKDLKDLYSFYNSLNSFFSFYNAKSFDVVDRNGNIIAKIDEKGLHSINYNEEAQAQTNDADFTSFKAVDKFGNVICKISKDGIQSIAFLNENGMPITNENALSGKELFVVGDSLSAGGIWEARVAEITGCTFDQSKNSRPGSQISTGGTPSYGGGKDCGLARILNLKKEGYNPDIIILENVNDSYAFNNTGEPISGSINDTPYIINQILEGYNLSDWQTDAVALLSGIASENREFGTSLQLLTTTSGKNLKILTTASNEGNIRIGVSTAQTGLLYYNIHVLTTDSIYDIVNKILEYNYSMVTDTIGDDNISVNFSSGSTSYPCSISFADIDNTGVTVSITDVDNAKTVQTRVFKGSNLTTDWENPDKWNGTVSFFSAWKGMIEFAKLNYPAAELILLIFPCYSMTPSNYMNADGTFDQESYNNAHKRIEGMFENQKKVADIYNIPVIDIHHHCGITVGNYNQYYWNDNVHPKEVGYNYFGGKIAKALLNILA